MSTTSVTGLSGQETLIASWRALARVSTGARVVRTQTTVAAVFPDWAPLNNAILLDEPSSLTASMAAVDLKHLYDAAGVDSWALWLPASAPSLGTPDPSTDVEGMRRDTTTLVMKRALTRPPSEPDDIVRTSVEAASVAGDVPVRARDLPTPDGGGLDAWVIVRDGFAVAGAWSLIAAGDCGTYAVATAPEWRRRGLARALMQGVLADAYLRGARTASLQSTAMGEPLYASLGFEPVGRYEEWVAA